MQLITVEVGQTRIETPNPILARQVLEQSTAELVITLSSIPPAIGSYWHGEGGIYAGQVRGEDGAPDYHLIVTTDPAGQVEAITWGSAGQSEPGATSDRDGLANTRALCASEHDHPAAQWAADLSIDGIRDWYLPARHELRLCYLNVPEQFSTEDWYASSTQYSPYGAWVQDFGDGYQGLGHKGNERRAVAVRRFKVTP